MRLQLIIALVVWSRAASAQVADQESGKGDVKGTFAVYADDDATSVVTSVVDASVRLPVPVTINAHALVDAVSSASVDVILREGQAGHQLVVTLTPRLSWVDPA